MFNANSGNKEMVRMIASGELAPDSISAFEFLRKTELKDPILK